MLNVDEAYKMALEGANRKRTQTLEDIFKRITNSARAGKYEVLVEIDNDELLYEYIADKLLKLGYDFIGTPFDGGKILVIQINWSKQNA